MSFKTLEQQKAILEEFIVDNDDLEKLESLLAQFNIFEAVGVIHHEIRHSNFLAFLLNPADPHRIGDTFLKKFLKRVLLDSAATTLSPIEIDVLDLSDAEVKREWRNIDLLVVSPKSKFVCVIENKVYSKEHSNQLDRYHDIVLREFKLYRHVFIYLTLEGDLPTLEKDQQNWLTYDYSRVANLVDNICDKYHSTIGSEVYVLMNHYSSLIRRRLVKDSEVAELCRKIYKQHKQALDLIYENIPNLQSEITDFTKFLIQKSKSHGLEVDSCTKDRVRFAVPEWDSFNIQKSCKGWTKSERLLLFEFITNPLDVSLVLTLGPANYEIRKAIIQNLSTKNIGCFAELEPGKNQKWNYIVKQRILEPIEVDSEFGQFSSTVESFWQKFLEKDLPAIKQAVEDTLFSFS